MQINPITYKQTFGRALTSREKQAYKNLLRDTKQALGIKDTTAIVFDFNVPSQAEKNTAIGTTWSTSMRPFISFVKDMTGLNSIQVQPQGKISTGDASPYSGTTFAYGAHIIDLEKLETENYGNLLPAGTTKEIDKKYTKNTQEREYRTDYEYVLGDNKTDGQQLQALKIAHKNFKQGIIDNIPEIITLQKEFTDFKNKNKNWLEKETLFTALSKEYGHSDFKNWKKIDSRLFDKGTPESIRSNRIKEISTKYKDDIEFESFIQFIADKQQKESHTTHNNENIKIYGDCLIGFSQSEMWANPNCFRNNLYYGGPDPSFPETNFIQPWGLPALDYTKLGECDESGDISKLDDVGKLLYEKYKTFFERYDGVRIDAAWQFVTPFVYQAINNTYQEVKLPEINMTIFNIIKSAAEAGKKTNEDIKNSIMLELVGISAGKSREMTLNQYPHLYTTAYAEYDETPKKFMEKGYKEDKFYVGVGCHDNDSLINMSEDENKRNLHLNGIVRDYNLDTSTLTYQTENYNKQSKKEKEEEDFRTAKFAEIFSAQKQFFTLPDMFGMRDRINISGKASPENWTIRIPTNFEKLYFSQLSKGYGLNLPKSLSIALALQGKIKNTRLIDKCSELAEILRSEGPYTEAEANIAEANGLLSNKFEYFS